MIPNTAPRLCFYTRASELLRDPQKQPHTNTVSAIGKVGFRVFCPRAKSERERESINININIIINIYIYIYVYIYMYIYIYTC